MDPESGRAAARPRASPGAGAGYLAIIAAAVLWASIGPVARFSLEGGMDPLELTFWRALVGGALFGVHARLRGRIRIDRRDVAAVGAFALVGVTLFYAAFFEAVRLGGAALAAVLLYTAPAWVVAASALWLGEPVTRRKAAAVILILAGVALVGLAAGAGGGAELGTCAGAGPGAGAGAGADAGTDISTGAAAGTGTGAAATANAGASGAGGAGGAASAVAGLGNVGAAAILWGLVAGLAYATYYLFGKRYFATYEPATVFFWAMPLGALALVPFIDWTPKSGQDLAVILYLGVVPTYLAYFLYGIAIRRLEAGRAATVAALEPVVAAGLAYLLWREVLGAWGYAGAALVVAGVLATALEKTRGEPDSPGSPR